MHEEKQKIISCFSEIKINGYSSSIPVMKNNCPFCSPEIRSHIIRKTEDLIAVYNIAPILPGHTMIVPRRHVETIFDLNDQELAGFFRFAKEITQLLMQIFGSEGFDWSLQESEAAGQSIDHLHLHIIPRKTGDLRQPGDWYAMLEEQRHEMIDNPGRKKLSPEEMKKTIAFIQKHSSDHAV
jgi:bis(5'-adenosyl)-triphosphatase